MRKKSIIFLLIAAAGVCAVSAKSVTITRGAVLQLEEPGNRTLLLRAMDSRVTPVEPGKTRVPIYADGVLYEVIVVTPGEPRLIPAGSIKNMRIP